jgi:hypothetical protein
MFEEDDLPLDWGPGTENYPSMVVQQGPTEVGGPTGPTKSDYDSSSVRGWTRKGRECRVVPWYRHGVQFAYPFEGMYILEGLMAYEECPSLVEKTSLGRTIGYNLLSTTGEIIPPPSGGWLLLGRPETHRGIIPAWVAERIGNRIVKIIRHCRVIDINGENIPLEGW